MYLNRIGVRGYRVQPGQHWTSQQPESDAEQITAELAAKQGEVTALESQFDILSVDQSTLHSPAQSVTQRVIGLEARLAVACRSPMTPTVVRWQGWLTGKLEELSPAQSVVQSVMQSPA